LNKILARILKIMAKILKIMAIIYFNSNIFKTPVIHFEEAKEPPFCLQQVCMWLKLKANWGESLKVLYFGNYSTPLLLGRPTTSKLENLFI